MNFSLLNFKVNWHLIVLVLLFQQVQAQITFSNPAFTQICASSTFNSYTINFSHGSPGSLTASNQFIIEFSNDNFATATPFFTSTAGAINTFPYAATFSIPTNLIGGTYKFRIRSTSPASTSANSSSYSVYYRIQDSPFTINDFISNATFCNGGDYQLEIDNPGSAENDSPLNYSNLSYNWYRYNGISIPPTLLTTNTSGSYVVTTPGEYYVETNYGTCPSNSYSNRVTMSYSTSSESASITSSLGNPFCNSGNAQTILSVASASSYQWSKDGNVIPGATSQTYSTSAPGLYSVVLTYTGCTANGQINLSTSSYTSSIDNSSPQIGDLVTLTTDAVSPNLQWFLNSNPISGEISSSFVIPSYGNFEVVITPTAGCLSTQSIPFTVFDTTSPLSIPNFITPNNDGNNDTWSIPFGYTSGTNTHILIIDSNGQVVLDTVNYTNNWPNSNMEIASSFSVFYYIISTLAGETKKGSITVLKQ